MMDKPEFSFQIEPSRMKMVTQELLNLLDQDRFIAKVVRKGLYLKKSDHGCVYAIERMLFHDVDELSLSGLTFTFLRGHVLVEFNCVVGFENYLHAADFQTNLTYDVRGNI